MTSRPHGRGHSYGVRQHETRERQRRNRRDRAVSLDDGRALFATYRVRQDQLPPARRAHERSDEIAHARGQAMGAGLRIVDVCRADYQENGDWLVELRVEAGA